MFKEWKGSLLEDSSALLADVPALRARAGGDGLAKKSFARLANMLFLKKTRRCWTWPRTA